MEQGYDGAAVENPDFPAKREEEKILERLPSDTEFANDYLLLPTCTSYFLGGTLGGTVHTVSAKCTVLFRRIAIYCNDWLRLPFVVTL